MKFKKSILALILATSMVVSAGFGVATQAACSTDGESNENYTQPETTTYKLTLHLNGGTIAEGENITEFEEKTTVALPVPERAGYTFEGWYDNEDFNGNKHVQIRKFDATSDKEFWAKWSAVEDEAPQTYTVTLHLNGGSFKSGYENITSYTTGTAVKLPLLELHNHNFDGWYEDNNLTQGPVSEIPATATGDKDYYAKWTEIAEPDDKPLTYSVTFQTNGGIIKSGGFDSYTYGEEKALPTDVEKSGYKFDGWYIDSSFGGSSVTAISATDSGNKTFYAKWVSLDSIKLIASGGYEEGAYIEIELLENTEAKDYTVKYRDLSSVVEDYKAIDSELIRVSGNTVRADIVGLKAGNYDIQVESGNKKASVSDISVSSYDRSGYAHFNYADGVGAYNNDGTLKDNAVIVYVTEETKNTVSVTVGGNTYKDAGIVKILTEISQKLNGQPLVVRILGTIGAATWNKIEYNKGNASELSADKVIGINGKRLPTDHKDITQEELIKGGYNTLNTSEYSELEGLSSKATYDADKDEYDSAWNNCFIKDLSNVTVEGIGTDARIFQWGFTWKDCNSIEVRNLTFEDYTEDACSFEGTTNSVTMNGFDSKRIWVHHNTFLEGINYWDVCPEQDKHEGDGATDFKRNSYITISYNHYFENHKTGLIGGGDEQTTACVTFHHNWYEKCSSRLPLGREANMHMYNNFYDGSTGTNMSLRAGAYALIENCYFKNANNPITTQEGNNHDKSQKIRGVAKVVNCTFEGCSIDINNKTVFNYSSNTANRATVVDNDNIFSNNFDTDPSVFYYDAANNKSIVERLDGKNSVPDVVREMSGVHKN